MQIPVLIEAEEGKMLVAYLRVRRIPFTHIPNETGSSPEAKRRAIRMKQQGTARGFPDYIVAIIGVGMLYIELKRKRGSRVSPEQIEWVEIINKCPGAAACVAYGATEAIKFIESYLPKKTNNTIFWQACYTANNMKFLYGKNPAVYFAETTQYVKDLHRITMLRDKCQDPEERAEYDNIIHCMQEVILFMNSINKKDRSRLPSPQLLT